MLSSYVAPLSFEKKYFTISLSPLLALTLIVIEFNVDICVTLFTFGLLYSFVVISVSYVFVFIPFLSIP